LGKLSELEEDHEDCWLDDGDGHRLNGRGLDEEGQNDDDVMESIISRMIDDERGGRGAAAKKTATGQSIFEVINDSVLKMCGIRDPRDRKVILMHIESLKTGGSSQIAKEHGAEAEDMKEHDGYHHDLEAIMGSGFGDDIEGDFDGVLTAKDMDTVYGHYGAKSGGDDDDDDGLFHDDIGDFDDDGLFHDDIGDFDDDELGDALFADGDSDGMEEERKEEINSKFQCPLTKRMMRDPVICADGVSYERNAIERWLVCNDTSPVTQQLLSTKQLFPNQNLKLMIQELTL